MAPAKITHDYYAILCVTRTADEALIKASYKRLAGLRHPDKDLGNPSATAQFQLLLAAYSTLVDATQRRDYDTNHYPFIRPNTTTNPKPNNAYPTTPSGATNETIHQFTLRQFTLRLSQIDTALQTLQSRKSTLDRDLFEATRTLNKTLAALTKLDDLDVADAALNTPPLLDNPPPY
ncbi:hypothetical protein C8A00DRAFT_39007, partial [Chaetomidium leptoderma]